MPPDGGLSATIVFPLFNFVLRAVQTGYEFAAVPSETSDHLKTISHVLEDLGTARSLRNEKVTSLNDGDLNRIDTVIKSTEEALMGLERLVERARVDMSLQPNSVSVRSRLMWVMRDSNKVNAALSRLTIISQSLHSEIMGMRFARTASLQDGFEQHPPPRYSWSFSATYTSANPHLQDTIRSCAERRDWIKHRHSVRRPESIQSIPTPWNVPTARIPPAPLVENVVLSASINNVAEYIRENEAALSMLAPTSSAVRRGELTPARVVGFDPEDSVLHRTLSNASELDSGSRPHIGSARRPYAISAVDLPSESSRTPYSLHGTGRRHDISAPALVPAIPVSETTSPQTQLPSFPRMRRSAPSTMQSTALVLGSRVPREIVWHEPPNEESEVETSDNIQNSSNTTTGIGENDPPPAYRTLTDIEDLSTARTDEGSRNVVRRSTRRRPMLYAAVDAGNEIQAAPAVNAPIPDTPTFTVENPAPRIVQMRHSHLDWALEQHNRDVARVSFRSR